MTDQGTAVALAREFLREKAEGAEPHSVRAEQDGWIISGRTKNGDTLLVYLDIDDARPMFVTRLPST